MEALNWKIIVVTGGVGVGLIVLSLLLSWVFRTDPTKPTSEDRE